MQISWNYSSAESQNQNMHWFKNVQKLNKKKFFLTENKELH